MVLSSSWKMGSNCGALRRDLSQSIHARERAIYRSGHLHGAPTACVRFWNDGPNYRRNSTCNVDRRFHLFDCGLVPSSLIAAEPEVHENNDFLRSLCYTVGLTIPAKDDLMLRSPKLLLAL